MTTYVWRGTGPDGPVSVEHLDVGNRDDRWRARSVVDLGPRRIEYAVELGLDWVFRVLRVRSSTGRQLDLSRGTDGTWLVDGEPRDDLVGAVDIDLSFSPFTNTLPVRRLGLTVGAEADVVTAYVDGATLEVAPDPQRYTRLATDRYLFESLDSDFRREITVGDDGFVLEYPGMFRRAIVRG